MSFTWVNVPHTIRAVKFVSQRVPRSIRAKHTREGREPYPYYWSTHYRAHDYVPHPTLISPEHPTAPLHNLFARWHCVLHSYGQKPLKANPSRSRKSPTEPAQKVEQEAAFLEIAKQRKLALKLYRLLSMAEAKHYDRALEHSSSRVNKRPSSAALSAEPSKQLLESMNLEEHRRHWQMLPTDLTATTPDPKTIDKGRSDTPLSTSIGFKLVKQYRFAKMQAASQFVRLACQTIVTHDHHPEIVLHFLPDDRMFEVKVSTWTHAPRRLPDAGAEDGHNVDVTTVLGDFGASDTDFDQVTQSPAGGPTVLSPSRFKIPKTVNAAPGLTRKDFLLAWDLDGVELRTRSKTLSLAQPSERVSREALSTGNEAKGRKVTQASQAD